MVSDKVALIRWLTWLKKVSPELYALFKIRHPDIINALGTKSLGFDFDWGAMFQTAGQFVQSALPIYKQQQQFKQQLKLAKVQAQMPASLQYAQQQPAQAVPVSTPTSTAQPKTTTSGQPIIEIKIDKGELPQVTQQVAAQKVDYMKYLPLASVAIGALLLLRK